MQIILPRESEGRKLESLQLLHPSLGRPTKFLVDAAPDAPHALLELMRVGNDSRSALVDDRIEPDGSLVVASGLHPLFLVLGVLYAMRNRPLPEDTLLELATADGADAVPAELVRPHLPRVARSAGGAGGWRVDLDLLKSFLDERTARVRAVLPPMMRDEVLRSLVEPGAPRDAQLVEQAEQYAAVAMLVSSWLSKELGAWYIATYDFSAMHAAAARRKEQLAAQLAAQFARGERSEPATKRPGDARGADTAKKTRSAPPANNRSILDMFQRK